MKKVTGLIKLQIPAGKANPSPPVGPALGQHGVNIMEFCKSFNAKTQAQAADGLIIPVVITVYNDRSFTFITKTPPAAVLLKKAAGIEKGSGEPNKHKNSQKFDESVDVAIRLGVDPKYADQMVRGAVNLPHGTGKTTRVVVFAKGDKAKEAEEAGADAVGADDLVDKIQKENWLEFD